MKINPLRKVIFAGSLFLAFSIGATAQFNSGSTGADGALDLAPMTCPANSCEIQLPESGILNYTTVNIPFGKELRFRRNSRNTPIYLLAQGNVVLNGGIHVSASGSNPYTFGLATPGPGGFLGGQPDLPGLGPGGGQGGVQTEAAFGRWVGPLSLVPIVGGSGAGGSSGCPGGGGAGAIVIASSTSITGIGAIAANGGGSCNGAGHGSGGAIRLVANLINLTGQLRAIGAIPTSNGVIRIEATDRTYTGSAIPSATLAPINPIVFQGELPRLMISSVAGYAIPSYAGTSVNNTDLLLPNQLTDPISVVIQANYIPVGTEVRINFANGASNGSSSPCTLTGSLAASQCTATVFNLVRTSVTYLFATAFFAPPNSLAKYNPKGRNQIAKIKLEVAVAAKPKYTFFRSNGSGIDLKDISPRFLRELGI